MIYSFYDPEHATRTGLGNYIILDHIRRAAQDDLPFVYLGYWVEGSERMQYKVRYRPLERLGRDGWRRMSAEEQDRLISDTAGPGGRRDGGQFSGLPAKDGSVEPRASNALHAESMPSLDQSGLSSFDSF